MSFLPMLLTQSFSIKISTVALTRGEIRIVQANMLGAILSNLLAVSISVNVVITNLSLVRVSVLVL